MPDPAELAANLKAVLQQFHNRRGKSAGYIRAKTINGRRCYQVVKAQRVNGKPRPQSLIHLGEHPTIEGAIRADEQKINRLYGAFGECVERMERLKDQLEEKGLFTEGEEIERPTRDNCFLPKWDFKDVPLFGETMRDKVWAYTGYRQRLEQIRQEIKRLKQRIKILDDLDSKVSPYKGVREAKEEYKRACKTIAEKFVGADHV